MQAKLVHHNTVILKGTGDGLTISLDSSVSFTELTKHFRKRVSDAKRFFDGAQSNILFTGRSLSDEEERMLLDIINEETTLLVPLVRHEDFKTVNPSFVNDTVPETLSQTMRNNVQDTKYYQGGLRSGQFIEYKGSVVVIGDVNPGSEIIAEGNIIILGALKGMVHAGCTGNTDCFVAALAFKPIQLRIADIITFIPEDKKMKQAACAFIRDSQVFIAPLMNT